MTAKKLTPSPDLLKLTSQPDPSQTSPQPEAMPEPMQADETASSASGDGSHITALIEQAPANISAGGEVELRLGKGEFHSLFCASFMTASLITGLKSLAVDEGDGKARAATEALYDTISEIPALGFLLAPGGKKFQRIIAIGAFAIPMARSVRDELMARNAPHVSSASSPSVAPAFPDVKMAAA